MQEKVSPVRSTKPGVQVFLLLAGQEASRLCLEGDNDDGEFEVPLLLQVRQNPRPKEHLTLADTIQVGIQLQVLHLEETTLLQPSLHHVVLTYSFRFCKH